jgi:hypothetical protein
MLGTMFDRLDGVVKQATSDEIEIDRAIEPPAASSMNELTDSVRRSADSAQARPPPQPSAAAKWCPA